MNVPARPEFDSDVRRRIYEHVEQNGAVDPEAVRSAVRVDADPDSKPARSGSVERVKLSPEEFAAHVAALSEAGYLAERDGRLEVAIESAAETFERDDGTPVTVRLARERDSEGVRAAIREVAGERTHIVAENVAEALDEEPVLRRTRRRSRVFFVAVLGDPTAEGDVEDPREQAGGEASAEAGEGEVVGWVHIEAPELEKLRHTAELTVGVREPHRRQGVGSRLLERGLEWADQRGYHKVYQSVPDTNDAAIAFLEDHGWQVEAVREDHYLLDEAFVDEVMLAKWVEAA